MQSATGFDVDAAVIGRGAVGAAAALGLARAGLRVAIIGPGPESQPAGQGAWDSRIYAISPSSRALLQRLRVWDAIEADRIAPVYDMRIWPDTRPDAPELHFSAYEACVDALAWIIEGTNISGALSRALAFAGVEVINGTVDGLETDPDTGAAIRLAQGRTLRARLLVVADGARSAVRGMLGIGTTGHAYPQHAVVANFETALPHRDCALQWFGAHGVFAMLPLPGNRCSIVWSAPEETAQALLALDAEAFAQRVTDLSAGRLGPLRLITPQQGFPLQLTRVERLAGVRAVLVGDAAHGVHPLAGQGMNLGFGDVAELLEVVARREAFRDLGDPLLLRRYERARREPVATMQLATDLLQKLFDPDAAHALPLPLRPLVGLREAGWQLVARSPWLKRRLIAHAAA